MAADGATEVVLGRAPAGSSDPFAGGEMRSSATATTRTFGWAAQAPEMVDGAVFGLFAHKADWANDPWLDVEFAGEDTSQVQLAIHRQDAAGNRIADLGKTVIDLGFDAAEGFHASEVTLAGTAR